MIRNDRGFTIIELLIATAILAFMIAGMTIALSQQQRQFNLTKETVDIDQTGRTIMDFIVTEVRNAGARQGKNFSVDFVNGGSILDENTRCDDNIASSETGDVDSPPDCITLVTWDISRGMENDPANPTDDTVNKMPSTTVIPQINSSAGSLRIDLPDDWFDTDTGDFLDGTVAGSALIGARSRINLCSPDPSISCLSTPARCSECAMVFKGQVDTGTRELVVSAAGQIFAENMPVTFNSISELISGKTLNGITYGFIQSISSQASELSIVKTRTFRLDPTKRALEMSEDGEPFEPIVGGEENTPEGLESPGVVDLQFVFSLQDADGEVSKVGRCIGTTCNNTGQRVFDDFEESFIIDATDPTNPITCCVGRENDIRSVEIYLVLKSKTKPRKLSGGLFSQTIPAIADVAEKTVDAPSTTFKEPEDGFMYRVFTNTVYLRNLTREDFG